MKKPSEEPTTPAPSDQALCDHRIFLMGQLVRGVAHELNNVLTSISGRAYFLQRTFPKESPVGLDIVKIRNASDRAASIAHWMLAFCKPRPPEPKTIDPREVLALLVPILERFWADGITFVASLPDTLPSVSLDPTHLAHIVILLCAYASEVITGKGTVTVQVGTSTPEQFVIQVDYPLDAALSSEKKSGDLSLCENLVRTSRGVLHTSTTDRQGSLTVTFPTVR